MATSVNFNLCLDLVKDNEYIPIYKKPFIFQVQKKIINIEVVEDEETHELSKTYDGLPLMPQLIISSSNGNYDKLIDSEAFTITMTPEEPYLIDVSEGKTINISVTNNDTKNYNIILNKSSTKLVVTAASADEASLSVAEDNHYINTSYPVIFTFDEGYPVDSSTYLYRIGNSGSYTSCKILQLDSTHGVLYTESENKREYINVSSTIAESKTITLKVTNSNYALNEQVYSVTVNFIKPIIYIDFDTSALESVYNAKKWPHELYDFNFMYYTNYDGENFTGLIQPNEVPLYTYVYEHDSYEEVQNAEELFPIKGTLWDESNPKYAAYTVTVSASESINYQYIIPNNEKAVTIMPYVVTSANFTTDLTQYDYYHKPGSTAWPLEYDITQVKPLMVNSDNNDVINISMNGTIPDDIKKIDGTNRYPITLNFSSTHTEITDPYTSPIIGSISTTYAIQKLTGRVIINNSITMVEAGAGYVNNRFDNASFIISDSTSMPTTDDRWNYVWSDFKLSSNATINVPGNYGSTVQINLNREGTNIPAITDLYGLTFDTTHALDVIRKTLTSVSVTEANTAYHYHGQSLADAATINALDGSASITSMVFSDPANLIYGTSTYPYRLIDSDKQYDAWIGEATNFNVIPAYTVEMIPDDDIQDGDSIANKITVVLLNKEPMDAFDITYYNPTFIYSRVGGGSTFETGVNTITLTAIKNNKSFPVIADPLTITLDSGDSEGDDGSGGEGGQ